jgi:hypothetical protein
MTSRSRFPKPPCPPKVDVDITLGDAPPVFKRVQQTMDISRDTIAPATAQRGAGQPCDQSSEILLKEWIEWCRSTGREAHAADLIERTRTALRQ